MAELLVKQRHGLARELGEDVPVDVSAEPREAVGRREGEGGNGPQGPPGPSSGVGGSSRTGRRGPALCPPVLPRVILRKPWRDSVPLSPKAELELPVQPMSAGRLASEEVARVTFWPRVRVPPAAQVMAP